VQAIDDCPFVTRRVALLQTLASAVPEGPQLLADLARDPGRRPVVLLVRRPDLRPPDATAEEATWMMVGSLSLVAAPILHAPPARRPRHPDAAHPSEAAAPTVIHAPFMNKC
jgi:hypothetical protein